MTANENLAAVDHEGGARRGLRSLLTALGRLRVRPRTQRAGAQADTPKQNEKTELSDNDFDETGRDHPDRRVFAVGDGTFVLVAVLSGVAVYVKYLDARAAAASRAAVESVQAAKDSTVAMLSYTPDSVEQKLTAASDRLTGTFHDSYTSLIHDVVIPGAREKKISVAATVAAAVSESASANHAVVVLFVDQAIVIGTDAPTQTASVVEVTLDKLGNRWLVAGFEPK
ncbi:hypothetical protein [Mycobacterium genavense]|uniref:hypothetical protein n=1 Tax=Mycobacterium genavense TaxID=36812 RepID=UPI00047053FD|nr:hypothetical protein [Mycobacterium genavense]